MCNRSELLGPPGVGGLQEGIRTICSVDLIPFMGVGISLYP
jgi:hypothetical protein